jgi:hypothetical protein
LGHRLVDFIPKVLGPAQPPSAPSRYANQ